MTDAALLKLVTGLLLVFLAAWGGWFTRARYFDLPQIKEAIDEFKHTMAMIGVRMEGQDKELKRIEALSSRLTDVERDLTVIKTKLDLTKRGSDRV